MFTIDYMTMDQQTTARKTTVATCGTALYNFLNNTRSIFTCQACTRASAIHHELSEDFNWMCATRPRPNDKIFYKNINGKKLNLNKMVSRTTELF